MVNWSELLGFGSNFGESRFLVSHIFSYVDSVFIPHVLSEMNVDIIRSWKNKRSYKKDNEIAPTMLSRF